MISSSTIFLRSLWSLNHSFGFKKLWKPLLIQLCPEEPPPHLAPSHKCSVQTAQGPLLTWGRHWQAWPLSRRSAVQATGSRKERAIRAQTSC